VREGGLQIREGMHDCAHLLSPSPPMHADHEPWLMIYMHWGERSWANKLHHQAELSLEVALPVNLKQSERAPSLDKRYAILSCMRDGVAVLTWSSGPLLRGEDPPATVGAPAWAWAWRNVVLD
jgi:hypothetical protein